MRHWRPCCAGCGSETIVSFGTNCPPEPPPNGIKPGKTPVLACDRWTCRACGLPWDGSHTSYEDAQRIDYERLVALGA